MSAQEIPKIFKCTTLECCLMAVEETGPALNPGEALLRRFKADKSPQNMTARARLLGPEGNNERKSIHDNESVDLRTR